MSHPYLLEVKNLSKKFPHKTDFLGNAIGHVHAVNDVSFSIKKGETLGIVGESGCGKTTLGRALLRLIEPSAGHVLFDGVDITTLGEEAMRKMRQKMQIIFQDPYAALNPRQTIEFIVSEPLRINKLYDSKVEEKKRVKELLDYVELSTSVLQKYPHEFSGGQRQRICIARALASKPAFIVCDEAVSALDVSIQAKIINLLKDLQKRLQLTYLFIAHNLHVVAHMADEVAVMYLGKIIEKGSVLDIYENTKHPYTKALLSSIPIPSPTHRKKSVQLTGVFPSPINPPAGCHFHPRCWKATEKCKKDYPGITALEGHTFRCHHPLDAKPKSSDKA